MAIIWPDFTMFERALPWRRINKLRYSACLISKLPHTHANTHTHTLDVTVHTIGAKSFRIHCCILLSNPVCPSVEFYNCPMDVSGANFWRILCNVYDESTHDTHDTHRSVGIIHLKVHLDFGWDTTEAMNSSTFTQSRTTLVHYTRTSTTDSWKFLYLNKPNMIWRWN